MSSVRKSVRPHFSKQNKFQAKKMFATGETVGLAEWIIDDTYHVSFIPEVTSIHPKWSQTRCTLNHSYQRPCLPPLTALQANQANPMVVTGVT